MKKLHKLINTLFWVPFIIAFIGYSFVDGGPGTGLLSVPEAIYASAALYFVNPTCDNINGLIIFAEISAIVVTTSLIISAVSRLFESLSKWWIRKWSDSTAIYTDSPRGVMLAETCRHGYISRSENRSRVEKTKDHIIMYSDDLKNLSFYTEHAAEFSGKRVFILLNRVDMFLMNSAISSNVHFININDIIGRKYWREHGLYDDICTGGNKSYRIALIGFREIGKAIFKYGYLNNIYDPKQKIEYHIWGCSANDIKFLESLNFGNGDSVVIHDDEHRDELDVLVTMNRIIIADGDVISILQDLLYENLELNIHCFSEEGSAFTNFFKSDSISSFGDISDIMTEEAIKEEKLYAEAKLVNYDYFLNYSNSPLPDDYESGAENEWKKISCFNRGSNIARADYYHIEKKLTGNGTDTDTLCRLEHLRWCRYLYYNRWTYGTSKNENHRTHPLLVPYDSLSAADRGKSGINNPVLKQRLDEMTDMHI